LQEAQSRLLTSKNNYQTDRQVGRQIPLNSMSQPNFHH